MIGHARETSAGGTRIAWGELGAGPPLVLLHGLHDSHRCWRRIAPLLARDFRLLMPDLPGHGLSGRPDAPYTVEWSAGVLRAWLDAVGLERARFVGHSLGGGLALWLLLEARARVERLALIAPGGLGREIGPGARLATLPGLRALMMPFFVKAGLCAFLRFTPWDFGHPEPEEIERTREALRRPGTTRAFRRALEAVAGPRGQRLPPPELTRALAELPPTALFWGEKDPVLPVAQGRRALQQWQGLSLTVYPGCRHHPHLEQPAAVAADLRAFLLDEARGPARLRARSHSSF